MKALHKLFKLYNALKNVEEHSFKYVIALLI